MHIIIIVIVITRTIWSYLDPDVATGRRWVVTSMTDSCAHWCRV